MSPSIMMEYEFALLVTRKGANSPPWGRSLPDPGRSILDGLNQTPSQAVSSKGQAHPAFSLSYQLPFARK
jgi:hypothetical protein